MPTLAYNVGWVQRSIGNYSVPEVLDVFDEIQNVVYSQNTSQTQFLDTATGYPPFLVTEQGKYTYTAPANCRETAAIFAASLPNRYSRTRPVGQKKEYYFRNRGYYLIEADTRPASPGVRATVSLKNDPGTTTDQYYHLYFLQATPLTDINQNLTLPDHTHFRLRQAVIALFRSSQYGDTGAAENIIDQVARRIRNQLNRGYQSTLGQTPVREEFQEYPEHYIRGYNR